MLFAQAAAEATAISNDNARAAPVAISGATGPNAAAINGVYEPTQEKGLDGRVLYRKRGNPGIIMEHLGGKWQVKPVSSKGKAGCRAYVAGGCALEDCTSRVWKVDDGVPEHPLIEQPSVKMATGREAERQVSGGCMRAHGHDAPAPVSLAHARMLVCDAFCFCTGC